MSRTVRGGYEVSVDAAAAAAAITAACLSAA